jgi:hypothetical protein
MWIARGKAEKILRTELGFAILDSRARLANLTDEKLSGVLRRKDGSRLKIEEDSLRARIAVLKAQCAQVCTAKVQLITPAESLSRAQHWANSDDPGLRHFGRRRLREIAKQSQVWDAQRLRLEAPYADSFWWARPVFDRVKIRLKTPLAAPQRKTMVEVEEEITAGKIKNERVLLACRMKAIAQTGNHNGKFLSDHEHGLAEMMVELWEWRNGKRGFELPVQSEIWNFDIRGARRSRGIVSAPAARRRLFASGNRVWGWQPGKTGDNAGMVASRKAHNLASVGSIPAPAIRFQRSSQQGLGRQAVTRAGNQVRSTASRFERLGCREKQWRERE